MSRLGFAQVERASASQPSRWSALRFIAWTVLMCAMVFWATLILME